MFNRATLAGCALLALFLLAGCGSSHHTAYVTTPLNNGIAAFRIDDHSGKLSQIPGSPYPGGLSPNAVVVYPSGKFAYVANGGGNDISSLTNMIVAMQHEKRRFVEHVDFVTSPGWLNGIGEATSVQ